MPNPNAAALTADRALLLSKLSGRTLHAFALAFLSVAFALFASASLTPFARTGIGLSVALAMIFAGSYASSGTQTARREFSLSSVSLCGYLLAAFFAQASYYVAGLEHFEFPYFAWICQLGLALLAAVQTRKHKLAYIGMPYSLALAANAILAGLASSNEMLNIGPLSLSVSSITSLLAVAYLAAMSAIYKWNESAVSGFKSVAFRVCHESYFVLTACMALALPKYFGSMEYAPLWWAIETPLLLAICWASRSFVKHALIMGIWVLSAVILLSANQNELTPLTRMALPCSGLVCALCYRFLKSSWEKWQKLSGYSVYLYGALVVSALVPALQLGVKEALPYFLVEAGLFSLLALALSDRLLQQIAALSSAAVLLLFASQWQEWSLPLVASVAAGCYGMNLLYGFVHKKGGRRKSEFSLLPAEFSLSAKEAKILEYGAGIAGYSLLISGSYLLFANPFNTMLWGAEAFILIAYGFLTKKVGHRFSGLVAMAIACAKLTIFDLSGAATLVRTLTSFGAVGVCCVAAGIFYLVEYGRNHKEVQPENSDEN